MALTFTQRSRGPLPQRRDASARGCREEAAALWCCPDFTGFVLGPGTSKYGADRLFSYRNDFVLVTLNYRLGALGWLGGAAVAADSADGSAGNFGLQDSREALRWVARNAVAFGGDAARVAICGESAGASMVETHLAAPRSARLFSRAILQSGAFDNYTTQADPEQGFAALAAHAGCPVGGAGLACLRALPLRAPPGKPELMAALANTSAAGYFGPAVDGVELFEPPEVSAAKGQLNPVRGVLLGSTVDEGRLLMPTTMPVTNAPFSTAADLRAWLRANFPVADPAALDALYAADAAADGPWGAAATAYTDGQYLCPTARSARWLAAAGVAEVYTYRLEYAPRMYETLGELAYWQVWCRDYARCANSTARSVGVGHGADVPLLFHDARLNATDRAVARTLASQTLRLWQCLGSAPAPPQGASSGRLWALGTPGRETRHHWSPSHASESRASRLQKRQSHGPCATPRHPHRLLGRIYLGGRAKLRCQACPAATTLAGVAQRHDAARAGAEGRARRAA